MASASVKPEGFRASLQSAHGRAAGGALARLACQQLGARSVDAPAREGARIPRRREGARVEGGRRAARCFAFP